MATLSFGARSQPIAQQGWRLYRVIMPLLAGGIMLVASRSPWLIDPLGTPFPAWQLPVDIGWQLRFKLFSYGLLCLLCSFYAFFIAYQAGHERDNGNQRERTTGLRLLSPLRTHATLAGLLCLMPIGLFFIQYLFIDMGSITQLAQHKFQVLFLESHFGYQVATPFMPIQLTTFDPATFSDRFALLLDQIQPGLFFPFLATCCLFASRHMIPIRMEANAPAKQAYLASTVSLLRQPSGLQKRRGFVAIIACFGLLLVLLGRGPMALASYSEAAHFLSNGDYAKALIWLDRASTLNPSLEQLTTYHVERGEAWYYLHPTQPTLESQAYLAHFYLTQGDYLSAYQQLIVAQQQSGETSPPWFINELSTIATNLAEMQRPLLGQLVQRVNRELPSINWLNKLINIDPNNVYAHYTLGRIDYDMQDYTACEKQMTSIINLSTDNNILSSAYTYLSLSDEAQGNDTQARDYLFIAQAFDPAYRNNTAREEISGLR